MNKIKIPIAIVLTIILIIMINIYINMGNNITKDNNKFNIDNIPTNTTKTKNSKSTMTSTTQVTSGLTEKLELHATYYFEEIYVEKNELVKKDEKILKYTNGEYLVAPYDLVITNINIPNKDEKVDNNKYIEVSAYNILNVNIKVDESKIGNINIGDSAKVHISAYDKDYEGIVTNISNTASNGKFDVTVEFENDSSIKLGMTAVVSI